MAQRPACPKCRSASVKLYPQEFNGVGDLTWRSAVLAPSAALAGGPQPHDAFWVCTACGHNFERTR